MIILKSNKILILKHFLIFQAFALFSCRPSTLPAHNSVSENLESAIYGGKVVDLNTNPFADSMLRISIQNGSCSGVLISANLALTACHCLGEDLLVYKSGRVIKPKSILVANSTRQELREWNSEEEFELHMLDLAFVVLSESLPKHVRPSKLVPVLDFEQANMFLQKSALFSLGTGVNEQARLGMMKMIRTELPNGLVSQAQQEDLQNQHRRFYITLSGGIAPGDSGGGLYVLAPQGDFLLAGINTSVQHYKVEKDSEGNFQYTALFVHENQSDIEKLIVNNTPDLLFATHTSIDMFNPAVRRLVEQALLASNHD